VSLCMRPGRGLTFRLLPRPRLFIVLPNDFISRLVCFVCLWFCVSRVTVISVGLLLGLLIADGYFRATLAIYST